jgi:cyclic beta-1,2-glucan synthetase
MCADIYGEAPHIGRGGWTWYTGAAGWMYRLTVETLLGLQLEVDHLRITPCIPAHWKSYIVHYRFRETLYHITVKCNDAELSHAMHITVDGNVIASVDTGKSGRPQGMIPLVDDRQVHHVAVNLS